MAPRPNSASRSAQIERLEGERDRLGAEVAAESRRPAGLSGAERAELALIEDRLLDLRRRDVAAERLRPSKMIDESLGPRPNGAVERRRSGTKASTDLRLPPAPRHHLHQRASARPAPARCGAAPRAPRGRAAARARPAAARQTARPQRRARHADRPLSRRVPAAGGGWVATPPRGSHAFACGAAGMATQPQSRDGEERRARALDQLLRSERRSLARQARFHSRRPEDAEDALSDACVQFLRFYDGPAGDDALRWMMLVVEAVRPGRSAARRWPGSPACAQAPRRAGARPSPEEQIGHRPSWSSAQRTPSGLST